jgi:replicative DNA helicase
MGHPMTYHDPDPEMGLLGCILDATPNEAAQIVARVNPATFTHQTLVDAWAVIRDIEASGAPIDIVEIARRWPKVHTGQAAPVMELSSAQSSVPSPANWSRYAQDMAEAHQRRHLVTAAQSIVDDPANAADALAQIESAQVEATVQPRRSARDVSKMLVDDMQARAALRGALAGISYGFPKLDAMTEGLQPGELVVVGARPSIGKTALAVTLLHNIAVEQGIPCLFITLETSDLGIHRRLLANVSGLPLGLLKGGRFSDPEGAKAVAFQRRIAQAPIWYRTGIGQMDGHAAAREIRATAKAHGVRVAFVDYLQKLKTDPKAEKRTYGIAENCEAIKAAAEQTGVAVVALAQLNREAECDEAPPSLRNLADSGQIERDADTVILIHRKRTEAIGQGMLIVAKARDGETGAVSVDYHGPTVRFTQTTGRPE